MIDLLLTCMRCDDRTAQASTLPFIVSVRITVCALIPLCSYCFPGLSSNNCFWICLRLTPLVSMAAFAFPRLQVGRQERYPSHRQDTRGLLGKPPMIDPLPPHDKISMRGQHVRDRVARGKIRLLRNLQPKSPLGTHQE